MCCWRLMFARRRVPDDAEAAVVFHRGQALCGFARDLSTHRRADGGEDELDHTLWLQIIDACEAGISSMVAPARSAIKRWGADGIALSGSSGIRVQGLRSAAVIGCGS